MCRAAPRAVGRDRSSISLWPQVKPGASHPPDLPCFLHLGCTCLFLLRVLRGFTPLIFLGLGYPGAQAGPKQDGKQGGAACAVFLSGEELETPPRDPKAFTPSLGFKSRSTHFAVHRQGGLGASRWHRQRVIKPRDLANGPKNGEDLLCQSWEPWPADWMLCS